MNHNQEKDYYQGPRGIPNYNQGAANTPEPTKKGISLQEQLEHLVKAGQELHELISSLEGKLVPITGPYPSVYGNSDGTDKLLPDVVRKLDDGINLIFDAQSRIKTLNNSLFI